MEDEDEEVLAFVAAAADGLFFVFFEAAITGVIVEAAAEPSVVAANARAAVGP